MIYDQYIESLQRASWSALQYKIIGPWRLGFSGGITQRANSASIQWHLLESDYLLNKNKITADLAKIHNAYTQVGLETNIRLFGHTPIDLLLECLQVQGYKKSEVVLMMAIDLSTIENDPQDTALYHIDHQLNAAWADLRWRIEPRQGHNARAILDAICAQRKALFFNTDKAVGRLAIEQEYGFLNAVAVDSAFRGQGLGKALVRLILNTAKKENIKAVYLEVESSNQAAIALYKSLGFSFVGEYYFMNKA